MYDSMGPLEDPYRHKRFKIVLQTIFVGKCSSVGFLPVESWTELQLIRYQIVADSHLTTQ